MREQIIAVAVIVWALRLGPFLFRRVLAVGEDQRFRHIKKSTFSGLDPSGHLGIYYCKRGAGCDCGAKYQPTRASVLCRCGTMGYRYDYRGHRR